MKTETKELKVLIACESSGVVMDKFYWNGHDAWSCDILLQIRITLTTTATSKVMFARSSSPTIGTWSDGWTPALHPTVLIRHLEDQRRCVLPDL